MIYVVEHWEFDSLTQAESPAVRCLEWLYLFDYPYIQYFSLEEVLSITSVVALFKLICSLVDFRSQPI